MTVLRNRDRVLIDPSNTAHRPSPRRGIHAACGAATNQPLESVTFVQALVYVKPTWCLRPVCFPGGVS